VFPCTLGTFSVKERVSLYFGYDLALKRVFPYTLGIFSVNECLLMLWARLVSRERVFTSALGAIRMMRQREREFPYALGTF
jgi:hypothetical protein